MKPGAQVLTTYHEAESRPTGSQDRKQSAVTSSSPGGALPARHSSLKTHTHSPGNGLYQHTHTHTLLGETTNIDADTQAQTRMQGNGPHQQRAAGVWANANTPAHTQKRQ